MVQRFVSLATVVAVLTLAACGGGGGGSPSTPAVGAPAGAPTAAPTSSSTSPASMPQTSTVAGSSAFISSSNQHTLYTFGADTSGVSNCTAASGCTAVWPPYAAPAGTVAPSGTGFSIITRSDGSLQWAYNGAPLYAYVGDSASGQDNGNGLTEFGGLWSTGRPVASVTTPAPTSGPTSTPYIRH